MDEDKLILVKGRVCLYKLYHKDCDNSLVKDNCGKEIAKKWRDRGRGTAGELNGMCELAFNTGWKRHGMCESTFRVI
jgi:hypothetical protein